MSTQEDLTLKSRTQVMALLADKGVLMPQNRILSKDELIALLRGASPGPSRSPRANSRSPARAVTNLDMSPLRRRQQDSVLLSKAVEASFLESRRSSIPKLPLLLFLLLLAVLAQPLVAAYSEAQAKFCGEGQSEPCEPCPVHAECVQGDFTCRAPYLREGKQCLENKALVYSAHSLLNQVETYVERETARLFVDRREDFAVSLREVRFLMEERGVERDPEVWKLLQTQLSSPSEYRGPLLISPDLILRSSLRLSVSQATTIYIQDHPYRVGCYSCLCLLALCWAYTLRTRWQRKAQAAALFDTITTQLRRLKDDTVTHGMSEDDIREVIRVHAGAGALETLWQEIERLRRREQRVCKFQQVMGGRPAVLWQWKGK